MLIALLAGVMLPLMALQPGVLRVTKETGQSLRAKRFPLAAEFAASKNNPNELKRKGRELNNRVLVLLVQFQKEDVDNPLTTGNGQFQMDNDPTYPIQLGKAPHNREYFNANMNALRYYYLAASLGSYEIQYNIWPASGAYTMPKPMAYYSGGGVASADFTARVEEYFKTAIELADKESPEIDFSNFGHIILIHAGSDYQHDINSDTPGDLPSFFINVGEGKEAVVDEGRVRISSACNVPETISQDVYTESDGVSVFGYGALNAVLAHEFGHSLGMVDLYNINSSSSMVGYYDIMDSGGMGYSGVMGSDEKTYYIEGLLPTLPGAWSRVKVFEEDFRQRGILKDVSDLTLNTPLSISPAEKKYSAFDRKPYIIKVPITKEEYVLLENRSVDPDGDGGTSIKTGLNGRVALYPTPYEDAQSTPSYEYDYLLPSWEDYNRNSYGGGLFAWHIDNDKLYNQGRTVEGVFKSNFELNSVNTDYTHRSISIIEADNLPDIGNSRSNYKMGTPYEGYFHYKPTLDTDGMFLGWGSEIHNPELTAKSEPPLVSFGNQPSLYRIFGIGQPGSVMSLTIGLNQFAYQQRIGSTGRLIGFNHFSPNSLDANSVSIITQDSVSTYQNFAGQNEWTNLFGSTISSMPVPTVAIQNLNWRENADPAIVYAAQRQLVLIEDYQVTKRQFPTEIQSLMAYEQSLLILTKQTLYRLQNTGELDSLAIGGLEISHGFADQSVLLFDNTMLHSVQLSSPMQLLRTIAIKPLVSGYYPVLYKDPATRKSCLFWYGTDNNIYKMTADLSSKVFYPTTDYTNSLPTQLGLGKSKEGKPSVFWGAGNAIFGMDVDGNQLLKFPYTNDDLQMAAKQDIVIVDENGYSILLMPNANSGYYAHHVTQGFRGDYSLPIETEFRNQVFGIDSYNDRLLYIYQASEGSVYLAMGSNPAPELSWNGYKNANKGYWDGTYSVADSIQLSNSCIVFPNPAKESTVTVRIKGHEENIKVTVYDIKGAKVRDLTYATGLDSYQDLRISIDSMATGIYQVVVKTKNNRYQRKLAVIH